VHKIDYHNFGEQILGVWFLVVIIVAIPGGPVTKRFPLFVIILFLCLLFALAVYFSRRKVYHSVITPKYLLRFFAVTYWIFSIAVLDDFSFYLSHFQKAFLGGKVHPETATMYSYSEAPENFWKGLLHQILWFIVCIFPYLIIYLWYRTYRESSRQTQSKKSVNG
jgi:hypothetical protein